jgi:N-acetylglutamate synthase-like GNAT family acetyltransferase
MTTRILPPDEWHRLANTEVEHVWPLLNPEQSQILAIEQDGEIVGTLVMVTFVHAECLWIHPDHRKGFGVMRRLLDGMWDTAKVLGARRLWSGSLSETTTHILHRLGGQEIPGRSFVFPVRE